MPLARMYVGKNASHELIRIVSEAVYRAMVEVANVPAHDKFQIINRHIADEMIFPQVRISRPGLHPGPHLHPGDLGGWQIDRR